MADGGGEPLDSSSEMFSEDEDEETREQHRDPLRIRDWFLDLRMDDDFDLDVMVFSLRVYDPSEIVHEEDVNVSKAHSVKSEKGRLLEKFGFDDHDLYDMVKHEDDGSIQVLNDGQRMSNYKFFPTSVLKMVPRGVVQERPPKRQEMDCQCQCHVWGCARGRLDSPSVQLQVDRQRGEMWCHLKVIDPRNNEHLQEIVYLRMPYYVEMEKKELLKKYCPNLPADDYVLVKTETDGSVEVLDDRQLMKHYIFTSTTVLQLALLGTFEDRPPRGLNQEHLMNEFGVTIRHV